LGISFWTTVPIVTGMAGCAAGAAASFLQEARGIRNAGTRMGAKRAAERRCRNAITGLCVTEFPNRWLGEETQRRQADDRISLVDEERDVFFLRIRTPKGEKFLRGKSQTSSIHQEKNSNNIESFLVDPK
jgi:hypothetical protein